MRLIRLIINLAILGVIVYVAIEIPIGRLTLWEHLKAISQSKESQNLVDEVKQKVNRLGASDAHVERTSLYDAENASRNNQLNEQERKLLKKIIREKLKEENTR